MKKQFKIITALMTAGVLMLGLAGCFSEGGTGRSPYEVATDLGEAKTEGEWLSEIIDGETMLHRLYTEAKADGYEGSFVDFMKEIGYGDTSAVATNRALMSSVMVVSRFDRIKNDALFGGSTEQYTSMGSGVIYSIDREAGDAYVITNYHVVYSASSLGKETTPHISDALTLYLYGGVISGRKIEATYVGGAMQYDVAVLKVENSEVLKKSAAVAITVGDSDAVTVGEKVFAVGNPEGEGFSVTSGVISVDAENIDVRLADNSGTASMLEMRTDVPINHGNSGGGLFNAEGKLVGIVNARSERTGVVDFGYAIPSNLVISVAQNIIDNSKTNTSRGALRATLGVTMEVTDSKGVFDEKTGKAYTMQTIMVKDIEMGSAAFGKLREGDVFYSIKVGNGKEKIITRMYMLTPPLFDVRKGDKVEIVVARGEEIVTVVIEYNNNSDFTLYA